MQQKVWLITVNMGYGHQRTVYPLRNLAEGSIINANDYPGIPERDRKIWEGTRGFYEFISNFKRIPLIGDATFEIFDAFQRILSFYPKRDLSTPTITIRQMYSLFRKGWGNDLIEKFKKKPLPLISSFFIPAFMAEFFDYPGEIFCIVCDADIARAWAPLHPKASRIKYFAPTERVAARLKLYGIKEENIFLTGYPLPEENIGTQEMEILKEDLRNRLLNLDPQKRYFEKYQVLIGEFLGKLPERADHILTIMFSVGGAGAQKEIALKIIKHLAEKIRAGNLKIILSAGTKEKVKAYFEENIKNLKLENYLGKNLEIIYQPQVKEYFAEFNQKLRKTDILWTKPSELSFYSVLGLPLIISPPIGSQEEFNMEWLLRGGAGIFQENPNYVEEWLFDWRNEGYLAEAAMQGFIEGEKLGTFNIRTIAG